MLAVARDSYRPFRVLALGSPGSERAAASLLQDRGLVDGPAAAYVCRNLICQGPVTEPEELLERIE